MLRGLYAAATSLEVASQRQEAISRNLAELNTPGYRQRHVVVESFDRVLNRVTTPLGDLTGARVAKVFHDFSQGPMQHTETPLDVALGEADNFFVVQGPNGPLYTRNGSFKLSNQQLVTQNGYPVLSTNGPITVPAEGQSIQIASDGGFSVDGTGLGKLRQVRFADPSQLTAESSTLYSAEQRLNPENVEGPVLQGYLEGSNVNAAETMTSMMIASRYYEAAQRAMRTISDSVQLNTRPQ